MTVGTILVSFSSTLPKPVFAGWVRKSTGGVVLRAAGKETVYASSRAAALRLFGGSQLKVTKGTASLLLFGREMTLSSAQGWLQIPTDSKKAAGRDIYAKYLVRAGRTRDDALNERLWLAFALEDLSLVPPPKGWKLEVLLKPSKPTLRDNSTVELMVRNSGSEAAYVSVFNVDGTGNAAHLGPKGTPLKLEARSDWRKVGMYRLTLAKGASSGIERFRVIATQNPVDLSMLVTDNPRRAEVPFDDLDPLGYLLAVMSPKPVEPGLWTVAGAEVTVRR